MRRDVSQPSMRAWSQPPVTASERRAAGLLGGLFGGVLMWIVASAAFVSQFLVPSKLIAATFLGHEALLGGAGVVVFGVAIHLVIAVAFGLLYANLASRNVSVLTDVVVGLAYGAGIYFLMTRLVLPWANPMLLAFTNVWFFVAHLAYGVTLALVVQLRRTDDGRLVRPPQRLSRA